MSFKQNSIMNSNLSYSNQDYCIRGILTRLTMLFKHDFIPYLVCCEFLKNKF